MIRARSDVFDSLVLRPRKQLEDARPCSAIRVHGAGIPLVPSVPMCVSSAV